MNIRDFPLAWRWTQASHVVLPDKVFAQMHVLSPEQAAELAGREATLMVGLQLSSSVFARVVRTSADVSVEEGRRWLRKQQPDLNCRVSVLWNRSIALWTVWGLFTQWWDDFCYPGPDNVLVVPDSPDWALFYHHEELFEYGTR